MNPFTWLLQQHSRPANVDGILTIAEKLFEANDPKVFARSLETTRRFMERSELYASTYNKLYALGGSYQFRYVDGVQTPYKPGAVQTPADSLAAAKASAERSRFDGWDTPAVNDSTQPRQLGPQYIPQRRPIPAVSGPVITLKDVSLAMIGQWRFGRAGQYQWRSDAQRGHTGWAGGEVYLGNGWSAGYFRDPERLCLITMNPRLQADEVTLTYGTSKPIKGVFEYVSKKKGGTCNLSALHVVAERRETARFGPGYRVPGWSGSVGYADGGCIGQWATRTDHCEIQR